MDNLLPKFTWIPLGVEGGLDESSLSAHLLAPKGSTDFICLDAGTLLAGLKVANNNGCFDGMQLNHEPSLSVEGAILHHHVKAYLISHPYLDHVEGLVVISPSDTPKPIIGIQGVVDDIRDHLFNWHVWPNLCNEGTPPALGTYTYNVLKEKESTPLEGTLMNVEAMPLAHGEFTDSTAFLVGHDGAYVLYMGDTGPDEVEKRPTTERVWKRIAPLIRERRLHAVFIETSYVDERPDDQLFSHLTPRWVMRAFHELAAIVNPKEPEEALKGLNVIVTHIKPDLAAGGKVRGVIIDQLRARNDLSLNIIIAEQGKRYEL